MCGRTACTLAPDDVVRACTYKDGSGRRQRPEWKDSPGGQKYWPSCNIAPTSHTPVLVSSVFDSSKTESSSGRTVIPMKWGLTPPWHKGDPYKVPYETNNCRAEGMLEKTTYKVPLQKGFRCVVLADGYFEWKTSPAGKQPYFFYFPQPNGIKYPGDTAKTELTDIVKDEKKELTDIVKDEKKDLTDFVKDEKKELTDIVKDEKKDLTDIVKDEMKELTDFVKDEKKDLTDNVKDEKKELTDFVKDEKKELTDIVKDEKKELTDIVKDEKKDLTDIVKDEKKELTDFVKDEKKELTDIVKDEKKELTDIVKDEKKDLTDIVKDEMKELTDFVKDEKKVNQHLYIDKALKQEVLPPGIKQEVEQDQDVKIKQEVPSDSQSVSVFSDKVESQSAIPQTRCVKSFWDPLSTGKDSELSKSFSTKESHNVTTEMKGDDDTVDIPEWQGQRLLTMAGVYTVWNPPDNYPEALANLYVGSPPLYSYSTITVSASPDLDWCHHRMPAILSTEDDVRDWLDSANIPLQEAYSLIKPHKGLVYHPVSKAVNNSRYKSQDCLKPVEIGKPKESPSSNMMMNWLKSGSPAKKRKTE